MSKTKSNKNKGRLGQQEVRDILLAQFPQLDADDCRSTPMGAQGDDILLSPKAQGLIPWNIEVKRKKKFHMSRIMEQAEAHGDREPVVFFREDRGTWYACVTASYLLQLIGE